jgi:ABC-type multidrug transport system ATPase subunit
LQPVGVLYSSFPTSIDFCSLSDKALAGVARSEIQAQLANVGFDHARQSELVGGLSGGWKMKLELARAMLYKADLLLLDEVRSLEYPESLGPDLCSI